MDVAGQLNYTYIGVPIDDCSSCDGTGYAKEITETMAYHKQLRESIMIKYYALRPELIPSDEDLKIINKSKKEQK